MLQESDNRWQSLARWWVLLLFIPSIYTGFFPGKITVVSFICGWLFIALYIVNGKNLSLAEFDGRPQFFLFMLLNVVIYVRGFFNIDSNTDKYALAVSLFFMCFLIPAYMYLAQKEMLPALWRSLLYIGGALCVVCYLFPSNDGMMSVAHNASFLNIFLLFIPFLQKKWRRIIVFVVIVIALLDVDRRSIIANVLFCLVLGYGAPVLTKNIVKAGVFASLILIPIILFIMGVSGVFNVFEYMEESYTYQASEDARDMFADSRTDIYNDVFTELQDQDAMLWGLGGIGKTHTPLEDIKYYNFDEIYAHGRSGTESGMLNYIQYGGMLGLLIYGLLLIVASYKAVFKSNNKLMVLVGLYVAFKFLFSFIEDRVGFQPNTFYLFLAVGMCYNVSLREMDDEEMREYIQQVFA